jgi:putative FmdB family regulatory protein
MLRTMPVYEFECEACGKRFEELAATASEVELCPDCGAPGPRRLFTPVATPMLVPRGAGVRSAEAGRREREAARAERLADAKAKRAKGKTP